MKKKLMTLEQRRLLREAQQLLALSERQKAKKKTSEASESGDNTNTTVRLTRQVMDFLTKRYDFRYNLLTEETEFRPAGQRDFAFLPVGKRNLNAFCIEAHAEGIPCWDKDLSRYIYSTYIHSSPCGFPTVRIGCRDFISGCWGLPRSGRGWQAYMPTVWRLFL